MIKMNMVKPVNASACNEAETNFEKPVKIENPSNGNQRPIVDIVILPKVDGQNEH